MIWFLRAKAAPSRPVSVRLLTRPDCGLCHEMKTLVIRVGRSLPIRLEEVDISLDPDLERRYLLEIPVLFVDDELAFRHRVGERDLRERLRQAQERT